MDLKSYDIQYNIPLAPYTTVKIGGPAEMFFEPATTVEFVGIFQQALEEHVPVTILGRGANVLIADEGIRGLVVHPKNATYEQQADGSVRIGAGMDLGALAHRLADDGFAGSEQLIGVPGTVGGAVYGNAGKGEAGIGELVKQVHVIDRATGNELWLPQSACNFLSRHSVFQKNQFIIIEVDLVLPRDIAGTAKKQIQEYLLRKVKTQPLAEATWGCTFRNALYTAEVGNEELRKLLDQKRRELKETNSENLTRLFVLIDEKKLLPASWLIDQAGCKGLQKGNLIVSDRHANFILNKGGGTATDAHALIEEMKSRVKNMFGIELSEEVRYLS